MLLTHQEHSGRAVQVSAEAPRWQAVILSSDALSASVNERNFCTRLAFTLHSATVNSAVTTRGRDMVTRLVSEFTA